MMTKEKIKTMTETAYKIRDDMDAYIDMMACGIISREEAHVMKRALCMTRNELQGIITDLELEVENDV